LALGGRCRTCRLPISPRYPIVEAAVGMSFALVGIAQLYRLSLPLQTATWHRGPYSMPRVDLAMLLTLLYHTNALALSWAFGLIRFDGKRLPRRLVTYATLTTVIPMAIYPMLMIVPWQVGLPESWWPEGLYVDALIRLITAIAAAVLVGRTLAMSLCPGADPKLDPLGDRTKQLMDLIAIIMIPAILIGWQALAAMIVFASLLAILSRSFLAPSCDALGRLAIAVPITLTLQLTFWRWLHQLWIWPSVGSDPWLMIAAAGLLIPASWWLRDREPRSFLA
ncbi:MAG: prepilin peptidase, partial [Pirellulales bacterium]|nr:prepilin peptidase [Pirellulales bacterium]